MMPERRLEAVNLAHDQITPCIRVSTALVPSSCLDMEFYYLETWIFSEYPGLESTQRIHGTLSGRAGHLEAKAIRAHGHIARNLTALYAEEL
jgi:hypothetical protein